MTPDPLFRHARRRLALLGLGACVLALVACGGSNNGSSPASLRALNLSSDLSSVDLYANDTRLVGALASDALSAYGQQDAATYTLKVKRAGEGTSLLSGSYTLSKDKHYTALVWGRETALRLSTLPEDDVSTDISAGNARVRVFNATLDSGAVDVFLTVSGTDIGEALANHGAVASGALSAYQDFSAGSWRLRVTGAGDPNDLRLDVPAITLSDRQHSTLVLTAGPSGVLVHATHLVQQGGQTLAKNTKARVRVVASVDSGGNVAASLGGRTLAGGLRSPSVGPYQQVDTAEAELAVRINGSAAQSQPRSFVAGTDYTLLVNGSAGSSAMRLLVDDNRLPTSSSRVKMRLLHGAAGIEPLTLSVDYLPLATDLASGAASSFSTLNSNATARIDVTAASATAPLYTAEDVNLQGLGVYTVFLLSGNPTATGVIRKER